MTTALITSAGSGLRMGCEKGDKPFILLSGRPVIVHTLEAFDKSGFVDEIILVVKDTQIKRINGLVSQYGFSKVKIVIQGGKTRTGSVLKGLSQIDGRDDDIVLIHDGVRPFVTDDIIERSVNAARLCGAAVAGIPCTATIKEVEPGKVIKNTPERESLWEAQTPQAFKLKLIKKAYDDAENASATDDSYLVEKSGHEVLMVEGNRNNIKLTVPEDIILAEAILRSQKK